MLQKHSRGRAVTRLEGQDMCLQTHIVCVWVHRCRQLVLGLLSVGAAAVLAPGVC